LGLYFFFIKNKTFVIDRLGLPIYTITRGRLDLPISLKGVFEMIGLEYIAKNFQMEFKTIAERVGVSPKTVNDWVKGRKKIPVKRLKQLVDIFDLKEDYFQKELSRVEEIEVQKKNVSTQSRYIETHQTGVDEKGETYSYVTTQNDSEGILQILNQEQQRESLLSEINNMVHVDNGHDNMNFFLDLLRLIKDDSSKRLIFLLIGSMSRAIGNATYGVKQNEKDTEIIKAFRELLIEFGYKGRSK